MILTMMILLPSILIIRMSTLRKKMGSTSLLSHINTLGGGVAGDAQQPGSKRSSPHQTPNRALVKSLRRHYSAAGVRGSLNPSPIQSSHDAAALWLEEGLARLCLRVSPALQQLPSHWWRLGGEGIPWRVIFTPLKDAMQPYFTVSQLFSGQLKFNVW